jgi:hypothetical protein
VTTGGDAMKTDAGDNDKQGIDVISTTEDFEPMEKLGFFQMEAKA